MIPTPITASRIIPADAGSTKTTHYLRKMTEDHPRGCGEHGAAEEHESSGPGSSPRMRGAQFSDNTDQDQYWIIPADAGSTLHHLVTVFAHPDHPRGCGEHHRVGHGLG